MSDPITRLQDDVVARLNEASFFSDITILEEQTGVTDNDVLQALNARATKSGKQGAAVLVLRPTRTNAKPAAPGPQWTLSMIVRVMEIPTLNRSTSGGTTHPSEEISQEVEQLLHHWVHNGQGALAVTEVEPWNNGEGVIGHDITLQTIFAVQPPSRASAPTISGTYAAVSLSCDTAGATIRYSTDGDYPDATNGTTYTVPFAVASGTTVRAVATKSALDASHVAEKVM
jgi:hypothetical protein